MTAYHARRGLIERVVAEIKNIPNIEATSVTEDPASPIESMTLPALGVFPLSEGEPQVLSETHEEWGIRRFESRDLIIGISAVTSSAAMRDEVCNAVEYRIVTDVGLGVRRAHIGVDFETVSDSGRKLWVASMRFGVTYHIRAHRPDEIVPVRRQPAA